jgi:hypothetical protein
VPRFLSVQGLQGSIGIFAVEARGGVTRAVICALPATGSADRVMVGILPSFGQAWDYYSKLDGTNPLLGALIRDTLALITGDDRDGKVDACYGTQVLTSDRPMALLIPVRVLAAATGNRDSELGPFLYDGEVIADTLRGIAAATNASFSTEVVEAFTHGNGIIYSIVYTITHFRATCCVSASRRPWHEKALDTILAEPVSACGGKNGYLFRRQAAIDKAIRTAVRFLPGCFRRSQRLASV